MNSQDATQFSKPLHNIRVSYAAATWAFAFAAMSFYWAVGGTVGIDTLSPEIVTMARNPWFTIIVWGTGAVKVVAGILALTLVQQWAQHFRWFLLIVNWSMGCFMVLYAGANLTARGLMAIGILSTPVSMHSTSAWWHLIFWDPWWLLGGILFCAASWIAQHHPGNICQSGQPANT